MYGKHQWHSNPADVCKSPRVTRLFAAVFEIFTADCMWYCPDSWYRNHVRVAHSYYYELLMEPKWLQS